MIFFLHIFFYLGIMFDYIFINILITLKKFNDILFRIFLVIRSPEENIKLIKDFKDDYYLIKKYPELASYLTYRNEYSYITSLCLLKSKYM